MDDAVIAILFFLAGVGIGTFVVGTGIRAITREVLNTIRDDYHAINTKAEAILNNLEQRAAEIKKAL